MEIHLPFPHFYSGRREKLLSGIDKNVTGGLSAT